jgi:hypothetical protein
MTEDKSIRCDECGQIVGMLSKNAHGSREEIVTGNDANCDYPPVVTCPDARLAFSRARRIEVLEEMQEQSVQDQASRDHKAPRRPKVTSSRTK